MERARETARLALDRFSEAELVIGTGVAGALAPGMSPGDIVVADRIVTACAKGPSTEPPVIVSEQARTHCEDRLRSAGLAFSRGALLTSNRVLASVEAKRLAREQSGAIAVDMESAAIASETERRKLPFVVVRTVMDAVDDEVFGADLADENGRVSALAATGYLARNPSAIAQLPRMMRSLGRATRSIADAIEALGFTTKL